MRSIVLLLSLFDTPTLASSMSCHQVRDVAIVVMEDPYLSKEDKKQVLKNLVGYHGMTCINPSEWDAND